MRPLAGLLILLYGLLLALNTGLPTVGKLAGDQVQVTVRTGDCAAPLGKPPYGGLYGACGASWAGSEEGMLFGDKVNYVSASDAYKYPLLGDYAVLSPSNTDQVAAITSLLIITLGILLLVTERKARSEPEPVSVDP
jgi:hypothetical protein